MKIFRHTITVLLVAFRPLSIDAMAKFWSITEQSSTTEQRRDIDVPHLVSKLFTSVSEWKHKGAVEIIKDTLAGNIIDENDISSVLQHFGNVLCARLFVIGDIGLIPYNIPLLFVSGVTIEECISDNIKRFIRNIRWYNFLSSSNETFAHSERAFALSLSNDVELYNSLLKEYGGNIHHCVLHMHNIKNPMCGMCKKFFTNRSPYCMTINGRGYFVAQNYVDLHRAALSCKRNWPAFLDISIGYPAKLKDSYGLFLSKKIEQHASGKDNDNNKEEFHNIVAPKTISDMLKNATIIRFIVSTYCDHQYSETLTFNF